MEPFETSEDGASTVSTKDNDDDETSPLQGEEVTTPHANHRIPWGWNPLLWTFFYAFMFLFWTAISESATTVVQLMNLMIASLFLLVPLFFCWYGGRRAPVEGRPHISWKTALSILYVVGLSLLLSGLVAPATTTNWYAGLYHWIRPCRPVETILHQLQYESALPDRMTYQDEYRPLQALGLDNGYVKKLSQALQVHFDRYGNNETSQFQYVRQLNLIGNIFDDQGASELVTALEHPHAYTTGLLLGRNEFIGDATAYRLAALIRVDDDESSSDNNSTSQNRLIWLEMGGTSITALGLSSLYHAMGARPFSYLGLEYTYKPSYSLFSFLFGNGRSNPIAESIPQLQHASLLQEISLTGNRLGDIHMAALKTSIFHTNITKLGLTNNAIGPMGVSVLVPLVATQLTELSLGINQDIGDDGAVLLAKALTYDENHTSNLEILTLFKCNVGQRGAEALLSIFPENTKLHQIIMSLDNGDKPIKQETLQALKDATSANSKR